MMIENLFTWIIRFLGIDRLGYRFSKVGERPFGFTYPDKKGFEMIRNNSVEDYIGIIVPNATVMNTIQILEAWNRDNVLYSYQLLKPILKISNRPEAEYGLCMFSLLHEIGHYYHFLSFGTEWDYLQFRKEYVEKRKTINFERKGFSVEQRMECEKQYLALPGEKEATIFALDNLKRVWEVFFSIDE